MRIADRVGRPLLTHVAGYAGQSPASLQFLSRVEERLEVRLPGRLLQVLTQSNGGTLRGGRFGELSVPEHVFQIDRFTSTTPWRGFWETDARYWQPAPPWHLLIPIGHDGHEFLCLDYRECGPDGEPAVGWVDDHDTDERIAESFDVFLDGLHDGTIAYVAFCAGTPDEVAEALEAHLPLRSANRWSNDTGLQQSEGHELVEFMDNLPAPSQWNAVPLLHVPDWPEASTVVMVDAGDTWTDSKIEDDIRDILRSEGFLEFAETQEEAAIRLGEHLPPPLQDATQLRRELDELDQSPLLSVGHWKNICRFEQESLLLSEDLPNELIGLAAEDTRSFIRIAFIRSRYAPVELLERSLNHESQAFRDAARQSKALPDELRLKLEKQQAIEHLWAMKHLVASSVDPDLVRLALNHDEVEIRQTALAHQLATREMFEAVYLDEARIAALRATDPGTTAGERAEAELSLFAAALRGGGATADALAWALQSDNRFGLAASWNLSLTTDMLELDSPPATPDLAGYAWSAAKRLNLQDAHSICATAFEYGHHDARFSALESRFANPEMAREAMSGDREDLRRAALLGAGCTHELVEAGLSDTDKRVRETAAEMKRQWETDEQPRNWIGLFGQASN